VSATVLRRRWAISIQWHKLPGALLFSLSLLVLSGFVFDSRFRVKEISIVGHELVSEEQINAATQLCGASIFAIQPQRLAQLIPTRCPGVEAAEVRCLLPNKVIVQVAERKVQFVWETQGMRYLLDGSGLVLMPGEVIGPFVLIRDLDDVPIQPGERVDPAALNMVRGLQHCMPEMTHFDYSRAYGVSITNELGWSIWFGLEGDPAYKVGLMKSLVAQLSRQRVKVRYIDIRVDERPTYQVER